MVCIINIAMRLQDLFENQDDDNKIQVLSRVVWQHIDPQISSTGSFKPIKLGEIPAFHGANLPLQLDNPTIDLMRKGTGDLQPLRLIATVDDVDHGGYAEYDDDTQTVILHLGTMRRDRMPPDEMESTLLHELRHAWHDYQSQRRALKPFSSPPTWRVVSMPEYLSMPPEIQSRFTQSLKDLARKIDLISNRPNNGEIVKMVMHALDGRYLSTADLSRPSGTMAPKHASIVLNRLAARAMRFALHRLAEIDSATRIDERLARVKGLWALVSRKTGHPLQYYHGSGRPSKAWVDKVERRIQYFKHRG